MSFRSEIAAKFAREAKEKPSDWVIAPGRGGLELYYIGDERRCTPRNSTPAHQRIGVA